MLRDISIGKRLGMGFALLNLFLVLAGLTGIFCTDSIQEGVKKLFTVRLPSVDLLVEADRDLQQALVAERSMIFADVKSDTFKALVEDYDKNLAQVDERFNKFKALTKEPEARKFIEQFEEMKKAWQVVSSRIVEGRRADTREGRRLALDLSLGEGLIKFEAMRDNLDKLTELILKRAEMDKEAASHVYAMAISIIASITFAGIIAGILLGLFLTRGITRPLKSIVGVSEAIVQGDLTRRIEYHSGDEVGQLAAALRVMVATLAGKIEEAAATGQQAAREAERATKAKHEAEEARELTVRARQEGMLQAATLLESVVRIVSSAVEELSSQVEQSSKGTEEQANRLHVTATSMEEMNATVLDVAQNASHAAETSGQAKGKAEEGSLVLERAVASIGEVQALSLRLKMDMTTLGKQAEGIGSIMNVISDIADQTNLLALNAAIEAARAGEAGRGFAVVAGEVRKLAEKTMTATKEVDAAITAIQQSTRKNIENVDKSAQEVEGTTELAKKSGQTLREIVSLVEKTTDQVRSIATASEQQSLASEEINQAVEDISRISSENSDAMRQSAHAVTELLDQAQILRNLIDELKSKSENTTALPLASNTLAQRQA